MDPVGVYVHIPFCHRKCGYCDFNAYSGYKDGTKARYVEALQREIANRAAPTMPVPTIFFGGGTPTTLSADALAQLLSALRESFAVAPDAEISIEANPADADVAYLSTLRAAGFNRLSFGVQTFNDRLLKLIDRDHSADDARSAIGAARAAGFGNVSFDLMFGLPRQSVADFERSLDAALELAPPHLSIYGLILEEGTPFWARRERGKLPPLPDEAAEAAMFARALARTRSTGYERYEISNYALPGYASRHNRIYWRGEPYLGFGAGATGCVEGVRIVNEARPSRYIERISAEGTAFGESERLDARTQMGETLLLGLRLAEGVDLAAFARRFGITADEAFGAEMARTGARGLTERIGERLRLTEKGLFLASEAMQEFV